VRPIVKYRHSLRSSVQKQLNRSRCLWVVGLDVSKESPLDGGPDPYGNGQFWVKERGAHCKVGLQEFSVVNCAKTAEPIEMPFGILSRMDLRNYVLDGVEIPTGKGVILGP